MRDKNPSAVSKLSNALMLRKLAVMALVMFAFGYALVPFYNKLCEVTGINLLTLKDDDADKVAANSQIDKSRTITVEFDANSRGPWSFNPERRSMQLHPGELVTVMYDIRNNEPRVMSGQAIPSYAPARSARYFKKLECFCFQQQSLPAQETKRFPVVFVVDPHLPNDVDTITLSYTFFEIPSASAAAANSAAPKTTSLN